MRFLAQILILAAVIIAYQAYHVSPKKIPRKEPTPPAIKPKTYRPVKSEIRFFIKVPPASDSEIDLGNGNDQPALVKLIDPFINHKACVVLIMPKSSFKISRVPPGKYNLEYALGDEIITGTERFWQPKWVGKLAEPLTIKPNQLNKLTLHAVEGGTVKVIPIPASQFDRD